MLKISTDLNDLYLFAQVVQYRGFTAAGAALGMPKSRLSRRISQLEAQLGVRLLQRNTRNLSLTDAGSRLLSHCETMIEAAAAGEFAVKQILAAPVGRVRISIPVELSNSILSKLLADFLGLYPRITLDVQVTNRMVNLLEEQFDIAVRGVGDELESSNLIQAHSYHTDWGLVASPEYMAQHGEITDPQHIQNADFLLYTACSKQMQPLKLTNQKSETVSLSVHTKLKSDNFQMLKQAALSGLGIAALPYYACAEELNHTSLIKILPNWRTRAGQVVVLFPSKSGVLPAVRYLLDFLKAELPKKLTAN
ncbi:MAG: LysR family transcriptional regulator [Methylotenera sp.]|nr:LysR family transcriptional regulator [Methylotenera sp.]